MASRLSVVRKRCGLRVTELKERRKGHEIFHRVLTTAPAVVLGGQCSHEIQTYGAAHIPADHTLSARISEQSEEEASAYRRC